MRFLLTLAISSTIGFEQDLVKRTPVSLLRRITVLFHKELSFTGIGKREHSTAGIRHWKTVDITAVIELVA